VTVGEAEIAASCCRSSAKLTVEVQRPRSLRISPLRRDRRPQGGVLRAATST
jgi:hypothetical protein